MELIDLERLGLSEICEKQLVQLIEMPVLQVPVMSPLTGYSWVEALEWQMDHFPRSPSDRRCSDE